MLTLTRFALALVALIAVAGAVGQAAARPATPPAALRPEARVALVIGNADYAD